MLFRSGRTWQIGYPLRQPATMVHVSRSGEVYAFIVGTGLIRSNEQNAEWKVVNNGFGTEYIAHLATDSADGRRLHAISVNPQAGSQAVLASSDGGTSWYRLGSK